MTAELVAFLRARLDEATQAARWDAGDERHRQWAFDHADFNEGYIVMQALDRLREIEAKRRIIELHEPVPHALTVEEGGGSYLACAVCPHPQIDIPHVPPCETLRLVGLPDDKHPDYREEWKP